MASLGYIKIPVDHLDAIELLGDAEKGRLLTSLMVYAKTGEALELGGNERYIFAVLKTYIDREIEKEKALAQEQSEKSDLISKIRSEAGKQGGRGKKQTKANESKEKQKKQKKQNAFFAFEEREEEGSPLVPPSPSPPTPPLSLSPYNPPSPEEEKDNTAATPQSARAQKKFVPPTVDEVREYCVANKLNVNAEDFVAYFTEMHWHDVNGNPVKLWKGKVRTWAKFNINRSAQGAKAPMPDPAQSRVGNVKQAVESMAWMDEFMAREGIGIDRSGEN